MLDTLFVRIGSAIRRKLEHEEGAHQPITTTVLSSSPGH